MSPRPTRQYSRDFRPHGKGRSLTLSRVPAWLLNEVAAKAKKEGVSVRAMLLRRMAEYLDEPAPKETA
jgi:hypothetical protein